jgi:hypothetical protein
LIRTIAVEQHEEWMDGSRCLIMEPLRESRKPSTTRTQAA